MPKGHENDDYDDDDDDDDDDDNDDDDNDANDDSVDGNDNIFLTVFKWSSGIKSALFATIAYGIGWG